MFESMRPADDISVQRNPHDERALHALLVHDLERINDHVGEFSDLAFARDDLWNVIELLRVRDGQIASFRGFHPDGLVVMTPVEQLAIAGLLQQIRCEWTAKSRAQASRVGACRNVFRWQRWYPQLGGAPDIRYDHPGVPNYCDQPRRARRYISELINGETGSFSSSSSAARRKTPTRLP